jgi:hypothetical protein
MTAWSARAGETADQRTMQVLVAVVGIDRTLVDLDGRRPAARALQ